MADMTLTEETMNRFAALCHVIPQLPVLGDELYFRYDQEVDVLYIMFDRDSKTYLSRDGDDGILWEYDRDDQLIGMTILDASTRSEDNFTASGDA
jgi:uncharacterized protein YuzE